MELPSVALLPHAHQSLVRLGTNLPFDNSREGFRALIDRIQSYIPLEQASVVLEVTGHYHRAFLQYLQELNISVYVIHVQKRQAGLLKTDKRDALGLANMLYNQLEKGVQVGDPLQAVRRLVPPTDAAIQLKGMVQHRSELMMESTQRKNKLVAICDEIFPELTQVMKNPTLPTALIFREKFPTPQALATANITMLQEARGSNRSLSDGKLLELQRLAAQSIGTKDPVRLRSLVFEQKQLLEELALIQHHLEQIDNEMIQIVEHSREGQILLSIPGIGSIQAAMIIAIIGNIANFSHASQLKSYFGWAPAISQSGSSLDRARISSRGVRMMKLTMYLVVWHGIRIKDCEWNRIYEHLVPIKCTYDERTCRYTGRGKVIGRIAGQIIGVIFTLLKKDQETLSKLPLSVEPPEPELYDPELHHRHRAGQYRASISQKPQKLIRLPAH